MNNWGHGLGLSARLYTKLQILEWNTLTHLGRAVDLDLLEDPSFVAEGRAMRAKVIAEPNLQPSLSEGWDKSLEN